MVTLRRMTDQQFTTFLARSIQEFAAQMVRLGGWSLERSIDRSRREHMTLLRSGLATLNHHLLAIELDGVHVGDVWLRVYYHSGGADGYIFHLSVAKQFRRRGIASLAMKLLEKEALRLGLRRLSLHTLLENRAAIGFFDKAGFQDTTIRGSMIKMTKTLPRRDQR